MRLLIVKMQSPETVVSPELRQIATLCATQARSVFTTVEIQVDPKLSETLIQRDEDCILLLSSAATVLTAASLGIMKRALDGGAGVVLPSPLTPLLDPAKHEPFYTLRGYERTETAILASEKPPGALPTSHLPVALFQAGVFKMLLQDHGLEALFKKVELLDYRPDTVSIAHAGLYFQFADYYGQIREDIMAHLPDVAHDVLEIGCGRGKTANAIRKKLSCRVTGIEMNPEIAKQAANCLDLVIVGDVEEIELETVFDLIIATELLEHLKRPRKFLTKIKKWLRPGGRIILSLPNVGHYSIVEDLLAGRWDYIPSCGILCYSHLRFFTRRTIEEWMAAAGFCGIDIFPQKTELPDRISRLAKTLPLDLESLQTTGFMVVLNHLPRPGTSNN